MAAPPQLLCTVQTLKELIECHEKCGRFAPIERDRIHIEMALIAQSFSDRLPESALRDTACLLRANGLAPLEYDLPELIVRIAAWSGFGCVDSALASSSILEAVELSIETRPAQVCLCRGHVAPALYAKDYLKGRLPLLSLLTLGQGGLCPTVRQSGSGGLDLFYNLGVGLPRVVGRALRRPTVQQIAIIGDSELYSGTSLEALMLLRAHPDLRVDLVVECNGRGIEPLPAPITADLLRPFFDSVISIRRPALTMLTEALETSKGRTAFLVETVKTRHEYSTRSPSASLCLEAGRLLMRYQTNPPRVIVPDLASRFGFPPSSYLNVSLAESAAPLIAMECESPRIVATDQSYLLNAIGSLFEATRQVPLVILAARSWKQWGGEASALNILSLLPKVRVFEPASVVELQFILERSLRADESTVISLVDAPPLSECEAMDEGAGVWLRRSDARLCVVSFGYATAILVREVGEISDCDHIHFNQLRPHLEPSLIDRLAKYSGVMTLEFNGMLAGFGEALSTQLRVVRHVEHMGINADVQNITFSRQLAFHGFDRSGLIQQINSFRARTEEPHSSTVSAGRYGKISSERQGIDEYLDQFLYRPVATLLVPILARNAVSPMLVTTASFVLGLVSSLAFVVHREPIAGGLLFLSIVLDCADGQLARLLGRTSPEGSALDHVFDDLKIVSISIALAFGFLTSVALHSLLGVVLGGGSLILSLLLGYAFVEGSRNGLPKEIIAADQLARSTRSAWMYGLVTYYRFRLLCVRRIAIAAGIPLDWSDSNPVLQSFTARLPMVYWLSVGPSAVATAFIVCGLFSWTRIFLRSLVFVGPFLLLCGFLLHHAGHWAIKSASERVIDRSKSGVWHP